MARIEKMKIFFLKMFFTLVLSTTPANAAPGGEVSGAFIQFNRANAAWPAERWRGILDEMQKLMFDTVFIQWSAEEPALYFRDRDMPFKEQYDALDRVMEAARGRNLSIFIGLQHDPAFWKEITARDKVLRDYFLVRQAQNERLQKALFRKFGDRADWTGYYITDEIDDLSWREDTRRKILKDYLARTIQELREADPGRPVAVSAFFRARTAPEIVAKNLYSLTADIGLDYLLIQDGAGSGDPPLEVTPMYYSSLLGTGQRRKPALWIVLEAFRQTSGKAEPFAAEPSPPERFKRQIRIGAGFERRIVFSFPEYLDPERGPAAKALFESLSPNALTLEINKVKP